jgi:hypothetical protein
MSGRRRNSGTLPGSRRLTFESRTFPKFWPDTESFESRGERSRKDSVYRDYTNFAGAESLADLSVWLSVRERPVDARNGPVSGKLVCRCIVVGLVFVVVLNFRLLPLSSPVVDASLYDEKRKKLLWTVELWRIVLMHYTPILFFSFFCGECGEQIQQQKLAERSFPRFHKSTTTKRQRFQSFSLMIFSTNSLVKVKYRPLLF